LRVLVVVSLLPQPVTWHVASNRRWLTMVASVFEPVKEGLKDGPGNSADLVPHDHARAFSCPLSLTAPAEEAVIALGFDPSGPHLFGQAMSRCEDC